MASSLLAAVFLPWGMSLPAPVPLLLHAVKVILVIAFLALCRTVFARLRIEQMVSFCWKRVAPPALRAAPRQRGPERSEALMRWPGRMLGEVLRHAGPRPATVAYPAVPVGLAAGVPRQDPLPRREVHRLQAVREGLPVGRGGHRARSARSGSRPSSTSIAASTAPSASTPATEDALESTAEFELAAFDRAALRVTFDAPPAPDRHPVNEPEPAPEPGGAPSSPYAPPPVPPLRRYLGRATGAGGARAFRSHPMRRLAETRPGKSRFAGCPASNSGSPAHATHAAHGPPSITGARPRCSLAQGGHGLRRCVPRPTGPSGTVNEPAPELGLLHETS